MKRFIFILAIICMIFIPTSTFAASNGLYNEQTYQTTNYQTTSYQTTNYQAANFNKQELFGLDSVYRGFDEMFAQIRIWLVVDIRHTTNNIPKESMDIWRSWYCNWNWSWAFGFEAFYSWSWSWTSDWKSNWNRFCRWAWW